MKWLPRFVLLLSITAVLAGCKLAVIVVEGGEVQLASAGTCVAGAVCIIDVRNPYFSKTFRALPDEGWYFRKWNSGSRFFCGGSAIQRCELSFQGFEESEAVADMLASSDVFYLMPVFSTDPGASKVGGTLRTIEVDGEERLWLQPNDFANYSYNQVSEVCPNGTCSGSLPGSSIDLTGYTWASIDDVRLLYNAYQDAGVSLLGEFESTGDIKGTLLLDAILSDPPHKDPESDRVYLAYVSDHEYDISHAPISPSQSWTGAWFWRPLE
jgi:hypothetical protein